MKPYVITSMALITHSWKKLPLTVIESHILTKPMEVIKDKLIDAFSTMKDKPVSVELKIKYV